MIEQPPPAAPAAVRLNIGAGESQLPGFTPVDRANGDEAFPLTLAGTPVADGTVDEIYASHVLEHFGHRETLDVLKEWVRALRPGGVLRVAVPDFDRIVQFYQDGEDDRVESYLMGGHTDGNDRHGAIFNSGKLRDLMLLAGLSGIRPWRSTIGDCAGYPVSLNLLGTKREPVRELANVAAVISTPRLCFTDQVTAMLEMVGKLRVPIRVRQGVFWGQTLTTAIEQTLADQPETEFVLTMDYDTVARASDVAELYRLMRDNPDAGAIFATQVGRDRDTLLLTVRESADENRKQVGRAEIEAELLPASTGHFGLTMLRVSALKSLSRPWFVHTPDADGGWGDGRVDEDIHFWRLMERAGHKVYQANQVVIGHLQLVVTWPDKNLQPIHQYAGDYRTGGKPAGVLA
jgi:hypothetical protein